MDELNVTEMDLEEIFSDEIEEIEFDEGESKEQGKFSNPPHSFDHIKTEEQFNWWEQNKGHHGMETPVREEYWWWWWQMTTNDNP